MKGLVSHIQRFSISDGPGLRTTVFLKGCPLDCPWCHNVETKDSRPSLLYYETDCVLCGLCAEACPNRAHVFLNGRHELIRKNCRLCGNCQGVCPSGALELCGKWMEAHELLSLVLKDGEYYAQSGGGVTISGGEPLMQLDFLIELLPLFKKEGVSVCLDTSGWGGAASRLVELVGLFLWDVKHTDEKSHLLYTGVPLGPIIESLMKLDALGGKTRLRCPIIPTVNDSCRHMDGIAALVNKLENVEGVDLVPYHALGKGKTLALSKGFIDYGKLDQGQKDRLALKLRKGTNVPVRWL